MKEALCLVLCSADLLYLIAYFRRRFQWSSPGDPGSRWSNGRTS